MISHVSSLYGLNVLLEIFNVGDILCLKFPVMLLVQGLLYALHEYVTNFYGTLPLLVYIQANSPEEDFNINILELLHLLQLLSLIHWDSYQGYAFIVNKLFWEPPFFMGTLTCLFREWFCTYANICKYP